MGLINEDAAYVINYGESFHRPFCPGMYASDIDTTKYASLDIRKKEAVHKARIADWELYDVAKSEANCSIVRVFAYVWISSLLKGSPTFYAKQKTKELLDHLHVVCTGHHDIDFLARKMHVSTDRIPQYIVALEKAQLQAAKAEMPILDIYQMMVAMKVMLLLERFPLANEDWEDLEKVSKSWMKWCELYNKVYTKETTQIQSGEK